MISGVRAFGLLIRCREGHKGALCAGGGWVMSSQVLDGGTCGVSRGGD
jgi:hypothetical protein